MTTLADIARDYGVTPQAVAKWRDQALQKYENLDFDQVGKRKEYTEDAVAKILEFAPLQTTTGPSQPAVVNTTAIEVYDSNPAKSLPVPAVPTEVNLAQFRRSSSSIIDLSTVVSTISFTKQLGQAMDADKERMYQELEALDAAEEQLDDAVTELDRAALIYEAETNILSRLQASKAKRVQDKLEKVQALGKPQTAPPPGSAA